MEFSRGRQPPLPPWFLRHWVAYSDLSTCRSLLSGAELARLQDALESDDGMLQHSFGRGDGHGRSSRLCLWNHPGNDITGMVGRCEKVAGTTEQVCVCVCVCVIACVYVCVCVCVIACVCESVSPLGKILPSEIISGGIKLQDFSNLLPNLARLSTKLMWCLPHLLLWPC